MIGAGREVAEVAPDRLITVNLDYRTGIAGLDHGEIPCDAERPESVEMHLRPDGSTPPASEALRWRSTMSCCGHPLADAGALQLLCSTCTAFVFAATYSCRGCGATGRDPLGWFLAERVAV